jgi:Tfp pilus assembly protein PilF
MDRRPGLLSLFSWRRLALGAVVLLALAGLGVTLVWPQLELEAAEQALRQHDPAAARARLECYLARWPGGERPLFLAARAARRSGACGEAERFLADYERQIGPTPASRLEWVLLGAQQGDFAGEEDRLVSDAGRNPADAPAILEALAKGYAVAYRRPEAIAAAGRLLERDPGHVTALLVRGAVYDSLRQAEPAEKDFRRAVELAPGRADAQTALAGLLNRGGHTREAVRHYELALRGRPGDPAALVGLARALTDAADLDGAERRLDEVLAADPTHVEALVERGRLALRRRRPAEAEPFLARAVRAAPWHRDGHQLYLAALKDLGRSEEAARCEARLAELRAEDGVGGKLKVRARDNPGDADVRWELWLWSRRNGQDEEGLAWLLEVLKIAPRDARAQAALAEYFDRAGQPRRAALHRVAAKG